MPIREISAWITTDSKVFTNEEKAESHQSDLDCQAIDTIMRAYSAENPDVHYPAMALTLVPFMRKNAFALAKILGDM